MPRFPVTWPASGLDFEREKPEAFLEIKTAWQAYNEFVKAFPFSSNPSAIDNLKPDDVYNPGTSSYFTLYVEQRLKALGHLSIPSDRPWRNARDNITAFKNLLRQAVDLSKSIAERVDAPWETLQYWGKDKNIAKKIVFLYDPKNVIPIFKTEALERFVRLFYDWNDVEVSVNSKYGNVYNHLTVGQKFEFLNDLLRKVKTQYQPYNAWDNAQFMRFVFETFPEDFDNFDLIEYARKNAGKIHYWKISGWPEHMPTLVQMSLWGVNTEYEFRAKRIISGDIIVVYMNKTTGLDHKCKRNLYFEVEKEGLIAAGILRPDLETRRVRWWLHDFDPGGAVRNIIVRFEHLAVIPNSIDKTKPINVKSSQTIQSEIDSLSKNAISLEEIKRETGYDFPNRGSLGMIHEEKIGGGGMALLMLIMKKRGLAGQWQVSLSAGPSLPFPLVEVAKRVKSMREVSS